MMEVQAVYPPETSAKPRSPPRSVQQVSPVDTSRVCGESQVFSQLGDQLFLIRNNGNDRLWKVNTKIQYLKISFHGHFYSNRNFEIAFCKNFSKKLWNLPFFLCPFFWNSFWMNTEAENRSFLVNFLFDHMNFRGQKFKIWPKLGSQV